jgi:hypothetical protein
MTEAEEVRERAAALADELRVAIEFHFTNLAEKGSKRASRWTYAIDALADVADAIRALPVSSEQAE